MTQPGWKMLRAPSGADATSVTAGVNCQSTPRNARGYAQGVQRSWVALTTARSVAVQWHHAVSEDNEHNSNTVGSCGALAPLRLDNKPSVVKDVAGCMQPRMPESMATTQVVVGEGVSQLKAVQQWDSSSKPGGMGGTGPGACRSSPCCNSRP